MLHVYLDQNKWVDLARAQSGHPLGAQFKDALEGARAAVRMRTASFPLSAGHFFETRHRRNYKSRAELGCIMAELSRWDAIAPAQKVVPAEIDHALFRMADPLGRTPAPLQIFGNDANHALGTDAINFELPKGVPIPIEDRSILISRGKQVMQWFVLVGLPTDPPSLLDFARLEKDVDRRFAAGQTELAEGLVAHGLASSSRLEDAMTATELSDILRPLIEMAVSRGLDVDDLLDRGGQWLTSLLEAMPSRWVTREMRRARHANPQQAWTRTDLNDVNTLSIAVPYCDVVVTERQWVHHLRRAGLADRFDTKIISDLRELPSILEA